MEVSIRLFGQLTIIVNAINNIDNDFEYYVKSIETLQYDMRKNNNNVDLNLVVTNYKRKMLQY